MTRKYRTPQIELLGDATEAVKWVPFGKSKVRLLEGEMDMTGVPSLSKEYSVKYAKITVSVDDWTSKISIEAGGSVPERYQVLSVLFLSSIESMGTVQNQYGILAECFYYEAEDLTKSDGMATKATYSYASTFYEIKPANLVRWKYGKIECGRFDTEDPDSFVIITQKTTLYSDPMHVPFGWKNTRHTLKFTIDTYPYDDKTPPSYKGKWRNIILKGVSSVPCGFYDQNGGPMQGGGSNLRLTFSDSIADQDRLVDCVYTGGAVVATTGVKTKQHSASVSAMRFGYAFGAYWYVHPMWQAWFSSPNTADGAKSEWGLDTKAIGPSFQCSYKSEFAVRAAGWDEFYGCCFMYLWGINAGGGTVGGPILLLSADEDIGGSYAMQSKGHEGTGPKKPRTMYIDEHVTISSPKFVVIGSATKTMRSFAWTRQPLREGSDNKVATEGELCNFSQNSVGLSLIRGYNVNESGGKISAIVDIRFNLTFKPTRGIFEYVNLHRINLCSEFSYSVSTPKPTFFMGLPIKQKDGTFTKMRGMIINDDTIGWTDTWYGRGFAISIGEYDIKTKKETVYVLKPQGISGGDRVWFKFPNYYYIWRWQCVTLLPEFFILDTYAFTNQKALKKIEKEKRQADKK